MTRPKVSLEFWAGQYTVKQIAGDSPVVRLPKARVTEPWVVVHVGDGLSEAEAISLGRVADLVTTKLSS